MCLLLLSRVRTTNFPVSFGVTVGIVIDDDLEKMRCFFVLYTNAVRSLRVVLGMEN